MIQSNLVTVDGWGGTTIEEKLPCSVDPRYYKKNGELFSKGGGTKMGGWG